MPFIRTALLAAALPVLAHAGAQAQSTSPPRKRLDVVAQGMTPAQVRAVLGEPLRVRQDGTLTYLYYANGCARCGGDDYVVVRGCRVVGARFENPNRYVVRTDPGDATPPPDAECALAAAGPAGSPAAARAPTPQGPAAAQDPPQALAADTPRRPPPPPDLNPRGAPPADRPGLVAPAAPEPAPAQQQDPNAWRRRLSLRRPAEHLVAVPASSISSPTAFGAQMGEAFVGLSYQQRTRFTSLDDGAAVLAVGFGDRRYAALEVALTSYSTLRGGGPLETGGLSFKLHHAFDDDWAVAVGFENAVDWGGSDAGHSPYAAATRVVRLRPASSPFSTVTATLGVGAGRFRSENDVVADRKTANVFASAGVQVVEPLSVAADWNGQDLFAGVSLTPTRRVPLVIDAGVADITGSAGDGARFILAVGLGFRWLPPFFF
jgi:hypothetical protein